MPIMRLISQMVYRIKYVLKLNKARPFQARANSREGAKLQYTILRLSDRYRKPLRFLAIGQVDATLRLMAQTTLTDSPVFANAECSFWRQRFRGRDGCWHPVW